MSKYRKIEVKIWNDSKFRMLSNEAKLVYLYLLTNEKLTAVGALKISKTIICEDISNSNFDSFETVSKGFRKGLKSPSKDVMNAFKKVSEGFLELLKLDFFKYENCGLLFLPNFLKYNPPANENVIKSLINCFDYFPECDLKNEIIQYVIDYLEDGNNFSRNGFERVRETVSKGLAKLFRNGFEYIEHRTKNIEHRTKNIKHICEKLEIYDSDESKIFEFWKVCMNSKNSKFDEPRKKIISRALKNYSVEDLKLAIEGCSKSNFHMGINSDKKKYNSIGLIFRNSDKIEQFIDMSKNNTISKDDEFFDNLNKFIGAENEQN